MVPNTLNWWIGLVSAEICGALYPFILDSDFARITNTTSLVVEPLPLGLQNRLRMEADWRKGNKQARRLSRVVGTVPCLAS